MCRGGGNFPDNPENIGTIQKLSRLSENFPGYPETFRTIQKISRLSGYFPETFRTIGNFPDNLESSQCNFKGYTQKLSGRAKTFRMAMPRCHDGFCASGLLLPPFPLFLSHFLLHHIWPYVGFFLPGS